VAAPAPLAPTATARLSFSSAWILRLQECRNTVAHLSEHMHCRVHGCGVVCNDGSATRMTVSLLAGQPVLD
jgi:hypothetical protein